MKSYCESEGCRRAALLAHFDEECPGGCGDSSGCDYCAPSTPPPPWAELGDTSGTARKTAQRRPPRPLGQVEPSLAQRSQPGGSAAHGRKRKCTSVAAPAVARRSRLRGASCSGGSLGARSRGGGSAATSLLLSGGVGLSSGRRGSFSSSGAASSQVRQAIISAVELRPLICAGCRPLHSLSNSLSLVLDRRSKRGLLMAPASTKMPLRSLQIS